MKRALFFVLAIAVAVSLLVIPAFASESYLFDTVDFVLKSSLPSGKYEVFFPVYDENGAIREESVGVVFYESDYVFTSSLSFDGIEYYPEFYTEYDSDLGTYTYLTLMTSEGDFAYFDYVEFRPYAEPVTMGTFLDGVGEFFTSAIQWLGDVLKIVVNSPALTVAVLAMPVVLFSVTLVVKLKQI